MKKKMKMKKIKMKNRMKIKKHIQIIGKIIERKII
jgi:hypothetical protein